MKINQLTVSGFRSHVETRLKDLGKFVLVVGPNGSGKSGLLDGLAYAFTGACRGTDEAGRGYEGLATMAEKAPAGVLNITTDKGVVTRMLGQGPKSKSQERINLMMGLDRQALRCSLRGQAFLDMDAKDQEALIRDLIKSEVKAEDAAKALGVEVDGITPEMLTTMDGVIQAYQVAYTSRTVLKKQLDVVADPELPRRDVQVGDFKSKDVSDDILGSWLKDNQEELAKIKSAQEKARGVEWMSKEKDGILKKLDVMRARVAPYPNRADLLARIEDLEINAKNEVKTREERRNIAASYMAKANHEDSEAQEKKGRMNRMEAARNSGKASCEFCGLALDKMRVKAKMDDLVLEVQAHEKEAKKAAEKAREMDDGRLLPGKMESDLRDSKAALKDLTDTIAMAKIEKGRIAEIDGFLQQVPEVLPDEKDVLESMEIIRAHLDYRARLQTSDGFKERVAQAIEKVEVAVKELGAGGRVRALHMGAGGGLAEILDEVSRVAVTLGVSEVAVDFTPKWSIRVADRPAELLSASERVRVSLAFAVAIARRTRVNMVCLDGADILDDVNRDALLTLTEGLGLDQVILSATSTKEGLEAGLKGWNVVYLNTAEDGSTSARQANG